MGIVEQIDLMVKAAGLFSKKPPSHTNTVDGVRLNADEVKKIFEKGDSSGSRSVFSRDNNGLAGITPNQARKNAYRDAYRLVKGDSYDEAEADRVAMEDMDAAQKRRYLHLKNFLEGRQRTARGPRIQIPEYDSRLNYSIAPHRTFVPGMATPKRGAPFRTDAVMAFDNGGREIQVPIYDAKARNSPTALGFLRRVGGKSELSRGKNELLSLIRGPKTGKYVALHEGIHTAAPFFYLTGSRGNVSYMDRPASQVYGKEDEYALDPSEALVATLAEKARLRAEGHSEQHGLGRIWAKDFIENRAKLRNGRREFDLNIKSLRYILQKLHEKANSPGATEKDKKNYEDFLDQMDYYFDVSKNERTRNDGYLRALA